MTTALLLPSVGDTRACGAVPERGRSPQPGVLDGKAQWLSVLARNLRIGSTARSNGKPMSDQAGSGPKRGDRVLNDSAVDSRLLESHLTFVASDAVRRAARSLVDYAEGQPGVVGEANLHGVVRAYKYVIGTENPLAFIFNRSSLLFYVRNPALRLPAVRALVDRWELREGHTRRRNHGTSPQ